MNKFTLTCVLTGISLLTTACSTLDYEPYGYREGWRRSQIMEIGQAKTMMQRVAKDCRTELGADAPYARYAVASYSYGGNPNLRAKRVVAVPNAMNLNVGDWVYVNITDCQQPLKRVDQRKMLD